MTTKDIGWLAGLLEGEGSFGFYDNSPRIWIGMSDEDVIDAVRRLLNLGQKIHRKKPGPLATKPCYVLCVSGRKAVGVMMTVYPLMGARRRRKIRAVLAGWRSVRLGRHAGAGTKPYYEPVPLGVCY